VPWKKEKETVSAGSGVEAKVRKARRRKGRNKAKKRLELKASQLSGLVFKVRNNLNFKTNQANLPLGFGPLPATSPFSFEIADEGLSCVTIL